MRLTCKTSSVAVSSYSVEMLSPVKSDCLVSATTMAALHFEQHEKCTGRGQDSFKKVLLCSRADLHEVFS